MHTTIIQLQRERTESAIANDLSAAACKWIFVCFFVFLSSRRKHFTKWIDDVCLVNVQCSVHVMIRILRVAHWAAAAAAVGTLQLYWTGVVVVVVSV